MSYLGESAPSRLSNTRLGESNNCKKMGNINYNESSILLKRKNIITPKNCLFSKQVCCICTSLFSFSYSYMYLIVQSQDVYVPTDVLSGVSLTGFSSFFVLTCLSWLFADDFAAWLLCSEPIEHLYLQCPVNLLWSEIKDNNQGHYYSRLGKTRREIQIIIMQ